MNTVLGDPAHGVGKLAGFARSVSAYHTITRTGPAAPATPGAINGSPVIPPAASNPKPCANRFIAIPLEFRPTTPCGH